MRIIVTGAAGFIGSHVGEGLAARGHQVIALDDLSGGFKRNLVGDVAFHQVDLRDAAATEKVICGHQPEILCHLAANAREGASQFQPRDVCARNLTAYINALVPCINHGLKKVVLYSSMAVYGEQQTPFSEDLPRQPVDIYGVNKTAMEEITEILADVHGFSYTLLRPHNVFGERQSLRDPFRNVVGIFMNRILRGEPLYLYGDGEQKRAFSYIADSLPSFLRACDLDPALDQQIINVGGIEAVTINELADLVVAQFDAKPQIKHLPDRPREVKYAFSTWEKAAKLLGYAEPFGMREGIRRMAAWAKTLGPQPWTEETLELPSDRAPVIWTQNR